MRTSGYCKVAELLLVHLPKMNSFRSFEDQLEFTELIQWILNYSLSFIVVVWLESKVLQPLIFEQRGSWEASSHFFWSCLIYLRASSSGLASHTHIRKSVSGNHYTASFVPTLRFCLENSIFCSGSTLLLSIYKIFCWNQIITFILLQKYCFNIYVITINIDNDNSDHRSWITK